MLKASDARGPASLPGGVAFVKVLRPGEIGKRRDSWSACVLQCWGAGVGAGAEAQFACCCSSQWKSIKEGF